MERSVGRKDSQFGALVASIYDAVLLTGSQDFIRSASGRRRHAYRISSTALEKKGRLLMVVVGVPSNATTRTAN